MNESELLYSKTHEWIKQEGDTCTVGISRFAVEQLTDLVYVELPAVGKTLEAGDQFGVVESVKAVSELYSPVAGEVVAVNTPVANDPTILSNDPYDAGWLLKLKVAPGVDTSTLLDKAGYDAVCDAEAH